MNKRKIVVLWGSVREGSYTSMAVRLVEDELKGHADYSVEMFDPRGLRLALPGQTVDQSSHKALQNSVAGATGVIVVSPEYHGGISSPMKLIIDNLGFPSVLEGKPVAVMGVAAGVIGAIKSLEHLRSVLSHVGAMVLPGPVSVANCRAVFDEEGKCNDPGTEKRIRAGVANLLQYIQDHICPRIALEEMVRPE